jgi:hypothetical protein
MKVTKLIFPRNPPMITMMSPLTVEGKGLDVPAHLAELTRFVEAAARDGLPAHEMERGLWQALLRLGHDLQATTSDRNAFNPPVQGGRAEREMTPWC